MVVPYMSGSVYPEAISWFHECVHCFEDLRKPDLCLYINCIVEIHEFCYSIEECFAVG